MTSLGAGARSALVGFVLILSSASPAAWGVEVCDGRDDDLDGTTDPGCPSTCADPRAQGDELLVSDAGVAARIGLDRTVVWDGLGLATVWTELVGPDEQVMMARTDPAGALREPPFPVSAADAIESDPVLDWSGTVYGVAWHDSDFGLERIRFAAVDAGGAIVAGPLVVDPSGFQGWKAAIAWDGAAFTITWSRNGGDLLMRRVAEDGTFLSPVACVTCGAISGVREVTVAPTHDGVYGHAWSDHSGDIHFVRSDAAGARLGAVTSFTAAVGADHPSLAWAGDGWGLAWSDRRDNDEGIYFSRLDASGVPLGPDVRVNEAERNSWRPTVVWTGTEFLVGWTGGPTGMTHGVYLRRVDAAGAPVGASLFAEGGSGPFMRSGLVWTGARAWFVRDEEEFAFPRPITVRAIDCCEDRDADGVTWCDGDLDDGDPGAFPGAAEMCNGRDDDQDGTLDEGCDRTCENLALEPADFAGRSESNPAAAVATDGPARTFLVRTDDPSGLDARLVLERGGPSWTTDPLETDPASSGDAAAAWIGSGVASVFRDARGGAEHLRFSARDGAGAPLVLDADLLLDAAGRGSVSAGTPVSPPRRCGSRWSTPPACG